MTAVLPQPACAADAILRRDLDALPRRIRAEQLRRHAQQLLSRRPRLISERVQYLLTHPAALERVVRRSYWHVNGFAKVRVLKGDEFGVRMHIWPAGRNRLGDVDPHGHRWAFASWIAAGEGLEETLFEEMSRGSTANTVDYVRYEYGRDAGAGVLRDAGPARLRLSGTVRRGPGEVYVCPRSTIHTVRPVGDGFLATVMLQGPAEPGVVPVFSRRGRPDRPREEPISAKRLRALLVEVHERVVRLRR